QSSAGARRRDGGNGNGGGSRSARLSVAARDLLTRLPLLSSLLEQIIQGGVDPSLVNFSPQRALGSNDPISAVFLHDLDAVNGGFFSSVSLRRELFGLCKAKQSSVTLPFFPRRIFAPTLARRCRSRLFRTKLTALTLASH